jgi:hypothetical protein
MNPTCEEVYFNVFLESWYVQACYILAVSYFAGQAFNCQRQERDHPGILTPLLTLKGSLSILLIVITWVLLFLMKCMVSDSMETVKWQCTVRYREHRLLHSAGT